ncbi:hypothetical protein [uncultured Friedmanniella sp.]|uniref:hypothetical protein n=1 Tax=uncultured Friedmanniella sp. TaxID=335381 RepID=UPI0035CA656A
MTGQEQANRTADLVLELVQARRKLAAIRVLVAAPTLDSHGRYCIPLKDIEDILDRHLPAASEPD